MLEKGGAEISQVEHINRNWDQPVYTISLASSNTASASFHDLLFSEKCLCFSRRGHLRSLVRWLRQSLNRFVILALVT